MSLLSNFPHTATLQTESVVDDDIGAGLPSWTNVSGKVAIAAWFQPMNSRDAAVMQTHRLIATHRVYLLVDPDVVEDVMRVVWIADGGTGAPGSDTEMAIRGSREVTSGTGKAYLLTADMNNTDIEGDDI